MSHSDHCRGLRRGVRAPAAGGPAPPGAVRGLPRASLALWGFAGVFGVPWPVDMSPHLCCAFAWPSPQVHVCGHISPFYRCFKNPPDAYPMAKKTSFKTTAARGDWPGPPYSRGGGALTSQGWGRRGGRSPRGGRGGELSLSCSQDSCHGEQSASEAEHKGVQRGSGRALQGTVGGAALGSPRSCWGTFLSQMPEPCPTNHQQRTPFNAIR